MSKASEYAARFNKVFDYIDKHLDEELPLERLSQVANFSKFHFHRQFSGYTGISVYKYVQLVRLKRASYRLVFNSAKRIIDIALDAGFENPESFSRAFKNTFGQTPSEFRSNPAWQHWNEQYKFPIRQINQIRKRSNNMEVKIVNFEPVKVALLKHSGPPALLNDSVKVFIDWRKESGLSPVQTSRTFGIAYDNPDTAEPDKFQFGICGSVTEAIPDNPQGVQNSLIPGGRCVVLRHFGAHDRLGESIYPLYREWLPQSGENLRDFPLYFHYLNLIPETAEPDLVTDIYLPLK
ncbi:MAG: AraC family transcriptional regulator [Gallionella sp.]